ncbi:MAG: tetratricopeptide repeat protein [Beijerinckiaceae bacterium]
MIFTPPAIAHLNGNGLEGLFLTKPTQMKCTFGAIVAAIMLVMSFAAPAAAGQLEDAVAAYQRRDYAITLRLLRPLAEHGNADAQIRLENMYFDGDGVPQDFAEAVQWYRKAAEQGLAEAQYRLGFMYYAGIGVPKNFADAAKWYRNAADLDRVLSPGRNRTSDSPRQARRECEARDTQPHFASSPSGRLS